jgi:uncharacterized protein
LITYFDTSAILKLLVDDESGSAVVEQLWVASTSVMCSELGYVEARAALVAASRAGRLTRSGLRDAWSSLNGLWAQLDVIPVTAALVRAAADLADADGLRGYDAVHLAAAVIVPVDTFASSDAELCEAALVHGLHVPA